MIVFYTDIHFDGWWYWTYATLKVLPVSNEKLLWSDLHNDAQNHRK